ncbi:MAG: ASCH domain-containing protein [Myxococcota bacterium]
MKPTVEAFWRDYLATLDHPEQAQARWLETFTIGDTPESADEGAALLLQGIKTATSSLWWPTEEPTDTPKVQVGSLSIALDGQGRPVCVVETTALEIRAFDEIDAAFAHAYGEWGRTLEGWRAGAWAYYAAQYRALDKEPTPTMPLLCEWLTVVYPPAQAPDDG